MRRAALFAALALVAGCYLAGAARAGVPQVHSQAFLVEDARTGHVLASHRAHARLPIASLTKLMTVLLAIEHHKLTDVVTVDLRAAEVGEESIHLRAGEQITVRDLLKGALIQSANDAADALALSIAPSFPAFAELMNAKAAELGLDDTQFVRPDGLDAPGEYSSAADITALARDVMRIRFVRETVLEETATISDGRVLHTWDDLLGVFPHVIGVKTGHTNEAGWCQVSAVRSRGVTVYVTLLGGPSRSVRNVDLESLLAWGESRFRVVSPIEPGRAYATVGLPYGRRALDLVAAKQMRLVVQLGHPLTERVVAATAVSLPVRRGTVLGHVEIWSGTDLLGRRDLVASRTVNRPGLAGRLGFYAGRTFHNLVHLF